jgi:hypothetical protein
MPDLPFVLTAAPFPEGWQGNLDEYGQQLYQNTKGKVQGQFLTGLILPPGSTLPTSNQGPVAMGGTWYFWDTATQQYLPQSVTQKITKNFARNSSYQVAQQGTTFTVGAGVTQTFDMCLVRSTAASVLAISAAAGPPASTDNDLTVGAIKFTTGPTLVPTLAATNLYAHEHLVEGSDISMLQGQTTSLSFSVLATLAGTYSIYITNGGRDQSYVANFTITGGQAGQWVRIKISGIPPFPTAGTWSYGEGTTGIYIGFVFATGSQWQTTNPNHWNSGLFVGTSQNTNMVATGNNQMTITGIKFEEAAAPTYYQCPSFATEYEDVIRYFFTTFTYQTVAGGHPVQGTAVATNAVYFIYTFPRRMCKTPSVVPWSVAGTPTTGQITNLSTSANTGQGTLSALPKGIYASAAPTATKGDVFGAFIQADARLS